MLELSFEMYEELRHIIQSFKEENAHLPNNLEEIKYFLAKHIHAKKKEKEKKERDNMFFTFFRILSDINMNSLLWKNNKPWVSLDIENEYYHHFRRFLDDSNIKFIKTQFIHVANYIYRALFYKCGEENIDSFTEKLIPFRNRILCCFFNSCTYIPNLIIIYDLFVDEKNEKYLLQHLYNCLEEQNTHLDNIDYGNIWKFYDLQISKVVEILQKNKQRKNFKVIYLWKMFCSLLIKKYYHDMEKYDDKTTFILENFPSTHIVRHIEKYGFESDKTKIYMIEKENLDTCIEKNLTNTIEYKYRIHYFTEKIKSQPVSSNSSKIKNMYQDFFDQQYIDSAKTHAHNYLQYLIDQHIL